MARFSVRSNPIDKSQALVVGDVRVSVISERIVRVERCKDGHFCDLPTQAILNRNLQNGQFSIQEHDGKVFVLTTQAEFIIDLKTLETLVNVSGKAGFVKPSAKQNLGGTARTLDGTFGHLVSWKKRRQGKDHFCIGHLKCGIFASDGAVEVDDSKSFVLKEDGSVEPREEGVVDKYIFAFGDDYLGGLKEFYELAGHTPLLPKYALGNWWSRYHAYTADEYTDLIDRFAAERVPLTVATIDMDWHIVKNVPKDVPKETMQGAGWTGYTFEKSLFPDHKAFLKGLKDRGLAVTMNLHPKDGVRYFEEQYEDMARACGIDPASKKPVEFDLTDERFLPAYFDILHHPYEDEGVDFWWIDWQQGTKSKMKGLDPLWLLNHYHFADNSRDGRRGLILSRYSGLGSHRYPLGFSGDTLVCWQSLDFQPYFTALASNAGYTWWSHDIGGHLFSKGKEELYLRWLEYGVFSPINRLHSSNIGISKEPWNYPHVEEAAKKWLRLRHELLPYLYTANVRTAYDGVPLVSPAYYYSASPLAYAKAFRNEYFFGEQLFVAPITSKSKDGVSTQEIWLPRGEWFDFFTGKKVAEVGENGTIFLHDYELDEYPVFAKAGAIVPMLEYEDGNSQDFEKLKVKVFGGEENTYVLYDEAPLGYDAQKGVEQLFEREESDKQKLASIRFELRTQEGKRVLEITPLANCKTKQLTIEDCGGKTHQITLADARSVVVEL
ncbi:MAG: alpha-xylosidase [Clostridia bacterium]|nr:alpha-xylosidase [Clostridia bacterium]